MDEPVPPLQESAVSRHAPLPAPGRESASSRLVLSLLLLATWLLLDLSLFARLYGAPVGSHVRSLVIGAVFGQATLVAALVVWLRINIVLRVLGGVILLAGISRIGNMADGTVSFPALWFGGMALYFFIPWTCLFVARMRGASLVVICRPPGGSWPDKGGARHRLRLSVWELLSVTTAVALVLAVARWAEFPVGRLMEGWKFFAFLACTAMLCGGAALAPCYDSRQCIVTAAVTGLVTCGFVAGGAWLVAPGHLSSVEAFLAMIGNIVPVAATAAVLRVAGFRLGWAWPRNQ